MSCFLKINTIWRNHLEKKGSQTHWETTCELYSSTLRSSTDPVLVPVVSATSSTSCGRQSWHCLVTSRRLSCLGKRLTSIRLSPWSSAWETPNPCCPTPLTPTKRWWSCPAPGNCPSTPTLLPSSSPSSPSPPRSVGAGLTRRCYCHHHRLRSEAGQLWPPLCLRNIYTFMFYFGKPGLIPSILFVMQLVYYGESYLLRFSCCAGF